MKKKFNLYCGLLIAAIVFGIGLTMVQTGYQMYTGGKAGWELAKSDNEKGVKRDPLWGMKMVNEMVPVEMMRKNPLEITDSIVNEKTGEKMGFMPVVAVVWSKDAGHRMQIIQAIGYFSWAFMIIFWIAFIKLIIAVNKGKIFEKSMETQLAWGGWAVLAMYMLKWVGTLYTYFLNVQEFEFEAYRLEIVQTPDIALLYSGLGMLLIGQIFKIGRQMKEEQELTI